MENAKKILVVEDERVVARDIQRSLANMGYSVPATAASAEQAIAMAAESCPDLVLMDIRIKGPQDGIEAATILRAQYGVPVIYLTAYADEPTVARAKVTEPFGYLLKPVKTNELRSAVEIALYKHAAEKRLRERERWLTTTMQSIGDAIVSTDATGHVNYMNPVAEQLTGWSANDACGRPADRVVQLVDDLSGAAIPNPLQVALNEARNLTVDGVLLSESTQRRFISDSTARIIGDDGAVLGAVMVFRDVSERRTLQRKLELADRLSTVGTMAAGVAHEVNNPLTYIMSSLSWALEGIRQRRDAAGDSADTGWFEEIEGALANAEVGASRVAKIVRDLSTFVRPGADPSEQANLNEILDWSLEVAGHELRSRGKVVLQRGDVPLIQASAARLGQVFVNLLINAAHALDSAHSASNEVVVTTRTDAAGRAVLEIRDTGSGMKREVLDRMFEPFFTTKPVGQGTGLGLSICHGIVDSLGGTIAFESEPDRGTLVRVTLPPVTAQAPAPEPAAVLARSGRPGSLMVVDDEPLVRGALRRLLSREHTVTCAVTSKEALELLQGGMRCDLILCDLMMPEINGMDFYEELMRRDPEQARRTVFLSGGAYTPRAVEFMHAVPNRRIGKPYDPRELMQVVGDALNEMGPIPR